MVFSSPTFLFLFMPLFFALYYASPRAWKNATLLAGSVVFYAYGVGAMALALLASIPVNQAAAWLMRRFPGGRTAILAIGILINLLPLLVFKYLDFLAHSANDVMSTIGVGPLFGSHALLLPPGISFFTFQAISYLVDVHAGQIKTLPSLLDFGMYHTSFPQLVAGPIVRYVDIETQITRRPIELTAVQQGIVRFCFGLAKKIIIADNMGTIADGVFALPAADLTTSLAWLGALAYMLQIFFDFSGYSDMAIGLGRMLGFRFPENFDQPYRSRSITEFWRRWHMTLSRWFRDYVYIPLGGNRRGGGRTIANLFLVFFLCGLWHGASYNFVVWGLFHGTFLAIERLLQRRFSMRLGGLAGWLYASLTVLFGWVIFRAANLGAAWTHISAMLMIGHAPTSPRYPLAFFLTPDKMAYMLAGVLIALAPRQALNRSLAPPGPAVTLCATACFAFAISQIAANGFNPFIYFRF